MFDADLPKRRLGILCPLAVIDASAYEFYQLAPPGVMAVMTAIGFSEYSAADVERVLAPLDALCDTLLARGIDLIMQSGVPLPLLIGPAAHDLIIERLAARTGKPATSTILSVGAAARGLGITRLVAANKWTTPMNEMLATFLARDGVRLEGAVNEVKTPREFAHSDPAVTLERAYELGREALSAYPDAEALFLGGQAWFVQPALLRLEREFGKPVISNQTAMLWDMLHRVDYWHPMPDRGRLLASALGAGRNT
jgi:maleate cis-trans isomerase